MTKCWESLPTTDSSVNVPSLHVTWCDMSTPWQTCGMSTNMPVNPLPTTWSLPFEEGMLCHHKKSWGVTMHNMNFSSVHIEEGQSKWLLHCLTLTSLFSSPCFLRQTSSGGTNNSFTLALTFGEFILSLSSVQVGLCLVHECYKNYQAVFVSDILIGNKIYLGFCR